MIKISSHIRKPNPDVFLADLAMQHWNYLVKQNGTKKSIKTKIDDASNRCLTPEHLKDVADGDVSKQKKHFDFLDNLRANDFSLLNKLIVSVPADLEKLKDEIFQLYGEECFSELRDCNVNGAVVQRVVQTKFSVWLISEIFDYASFRRSSYFRGACVNLGFESATCPYCNYEAITVITRATAKKTNGKEKAYVEADHFFQKSKHPFLALSFFNLIPSCHNCNAMDKGAIDFSLTTHVNPYVESLDDIYRFKIDVKEILKNKIENILIEKISKKSDRTFDDFNILAKYNTAGLKSANRIMMKFRDNEDLAGTPEFVELVFDEVADRKDKILDYPKSKLLRDILRELDLDGKCGIDKILSQ